MQLTTLPILYSFRRCPYAMRARMAIYAASIDVEHIEVSLKNKPQSLLDYSPKGTVPVVITSAGKVIEQSRDIMMWALQIADPYNWLLCEDTSTQKHMMLLVDECDLEFKPLLDRYKYFDRYPEQTQQDYRQQAELFLQKLDSLLSQHLFLIDQQTRFADIAIFPFIRQFAGVDKTWFAEAPYKNLQRWLDTCTNSEIFKTVMENQVITKPKNL